MSEKRIIVIDVPTAAEFARAQNWQRPKTTDPWRAKYYAVLDSPRWKALRARLIAALEGKCGRCNRNSNAEGHPFLLELHHKTYERLGAELDTDVEVLCPECHKKADQERADAGRRKSSNAYYESSFDNWATRRYGEDYEDSDYLREKFDAKFYD